ncbi:MAG: sugar-binding protein [Vicinamibacterales bacterium]
MAAVLLSFIALLSTGPGVADATEGAPLVPRARGEIRIDGRLDDEAWTAAADLGALTQREPREGTEPSERTSVKLLFDEDALYIAVVCFDSNPGAIVRAQMTRDADQAQDDNIEIVLDTFLDHRNGYYFQVNALGAQADGLISNNNEPNKEWDGIWNAKAEVTADGWTAEIAIPFKTLNFDPSQPGWGFNLQRTIRRKQETIRWRAARQNMRLAQMSEAGVIEGLVGVKQGRGLDVRPFAVGGLVRDAAGRPIEGTGQVGLDLIKNITPSLSATVTVNTDFAETEVDARQINLTRFSLFFPEKRTFFLQNAGIFTPAGQGQRADQTRATDIVPFFSRRIGLTPDNEPLPILAGAKLTGRAAGWNVGVLDIATRDFEESFDRDIVRIGGRNFFVARAARNFGRQSLIGVLVTHGNPMNEDPGDAPSDDGRPLVGVDARWDRSDLFGNKNLVIEGAAFRAFVPDAASPTGEEWAATFRADYPNDPLGINITLKDIGSDFRPGLGFVPRRGIRKGNYNIDYFQRPQKWGIRHQHWELLTETIHDREGRLLNWRIFTAPLNLRTESGEHIEWNYMPEHEYLDMPFEIQPGIVIPRGGYTMHRYRAELNTATKRRVIADVSVRYGEFYDGSRVETVAGVRVRPSVHLSLQLALSRNDVTLPQGDFTTSIWQARADVGFSPAVTLSNLFQYDTDSRIAGLNSRLRWIMRPGNDFFFVLNLGRLNEEDRWSPAFDRVTTKVQYTWRL